VRFSLGLNLLGGKFRYKLERYSFLISFGGLRLTKGSLRSQTDNSTERLPYSGLLSASLSLSSSTTIMLQSQWIFAFEDTEEVYIDFLEIELSAMNRSKN
jgi:hypothetical protein